MKIQVKIENFQFRPETVVVAPGSLIEFVVTEHPESSVYSSTERGFIIESSEFSTPPLFSGQKFKYTFSEPGVFTVHSPIYSWMRGTVIVEEPKMSSLNNPQHPDHCHVRQPGKRPKTINEQCRTKQFISSLEIPSSQQSYIEEEESPLKSVPEDLEAEEIERLFWSVHEECERDRVVPSFEWETADFCECPPETSDMPIKENTTIEVVNTKYRMTKPGITFTIIGMGPKRRTQPAEECKTLDAAESKRNTHTTKRKPATRKKQNALKFALKKRPQKAVNYLKKTIELHLLALDKPLYDLKEYEHKFTSLKSVLLLIEQKIPDCHIRATADYLATANREPLAEVLADEASSRCLLRKLYNLNIISFPARFAKLKLGDPPQYCSSLNLPLLEQLLQDSNIYIEWDQLSN